MLWFSPGIFVYKYTNQSSKYTNGTFHLISPNVPDEFFHSKTVHSRTVHSVQSSSTLFMTGSLSEQNKVPFFVPVLQKNGFTFKPVFLLHKMIF